MHFPLCLEPPVSNFTYRARSRASHLHMQQESSFANQCQKYGSFSSTLMDNLTKTQLQAKLLLILRQISQFCGKPSRWSAQAFSITSRTYDSKFTRTGMFSTQRGNLWGKTQQLLDLESQWMMPWWSWSPQHRKVCLQQKVWLPLHMLWYNLLASLHMKYRIFFIGFTFVSFCVLVLTLLLCEDNCKCLIALILWPQMFDYLDFVMQQLQLAWPQGEHQVSRHSLFMLVLFPTLCAPQT